MTGLYEQAQTEREALIERTLNLLIVAVRDSTVRSDMGLKVIAVAEAMLTAYEELARMLSQSSSDHFLFATDLPRSERDQRTEALHLLKVLRAVHEAVN